MGHNLFGALVVKLAVVNNVALGLCDMNCDGKGFNENHSHKDTSLVYNLCRHLKTYKSDHYTEVTHNRQVILEKVNKAGARSEFDVYHTLFSGEATTQLINTILPLRLAGLSVRDAVNSGRLCMTKLFTKGNDLNGFVYR